MIDGKKHPGIVFVATIAGERHAALAAGPEVWTVAESWLQHDESERTAAAVAEALGLARTEVESRSATGRTMRTRSTSSSPATTRAKMMR